MDTSQQVADGITSKSESWGAAPRQRRGIADKRRIVEETLGEGASLARVARAHGMDANQVFGWLRRWRGNPLQRIGALYGIEEQIRGRPPEQRRAVRQAQSKPLLDSLQQWFEEILSKLSRKSETRLTERLN
jgi:transposase-like protein